jgi:triosephosphate isomerase
MKKIIAANWKMNNLKEDINNFIDKFYKNRDNLNYENREILIAPSTIYFRFLKNKVEELGLQVKVGVQNCFYEDKGAFTGEISPLMLKDLNVDFVIIGHSERRNIFNENDELLNKKVLSTLKKGIKTIFCIGEKLEQRENNDTFNILKSQLLNGLKNIEKFYNENLLIAYEPVWAIGTGKTATVSQIEEVHNFIKDFLKKNIAFNLPILYGGSVKPSNIKEIINASNVDGVLVGGASLKFDDFIHLINFDKE